jgi:hypothetical protein
MSAFPGNPPENLYILLFVLTMSVEGEGKSVSVDEVSATVFQILSHYHYLEDNRFQQFIEAMKAEWTAGNESQSQIQIDLKTIFKTVNKRLRLLSLEVKTVAMPRSLTNQEDEDGGNGDDSQWIYYHGLVNTEEDFIAKEFGVGVLSATAGSSSSSLSVPELKIFSSLSIQLILMKAMSTNDILSFIKKKIASVSKLTNQDCHTFLSKLENDGWIMKNSRGFNILSPRSYLELKPYFETTLNINEDEEEIPAYLEDFTEKERDSALKSLPTLIIY